MTLPQPSGGFEWTQATWGAALRCAPLAEVAPHIFTTGNLHLADGSEEWSRVAAEIGVAPERLQLIRQVHGADVAVVRGAMGPRGRPQADIVVGDDSSTALGVRVADCAPVLIADRRTPAVAAVHAGWRGAARSACAAAVRALQETFGSQPGDLVAAIGPCLGPCCGEVGEDVIEEFRAAGHAEADIVRWFTPGKTKRWYLDLWAANRDQLARAGIPSSSIHVAGICTKTHAPLLHSYRVAGARAGRMAGVIRPRT